MVKYNYNAWGKCNVIATDSYTTLANLNPFRYRGYFYDTNLNLYYLKSRFYNPVIGRFITPDNTKYLSPDKINGLNLHTYCYNNPINYIDPNGTDAILIINYNKNGGLPVAGHAALVIQKGGDWYYTDYGNTNLVRLEDEEVDNNLVTKYKKDRNVTQIYLYGEYSSSYDLANFYKKSSFGSYNLIFHNCLDYVQTLLKVGSNVNPLLQNYFKNTTEFIPLAFGIKVKAINKSTVLYRVKKKVVNNIKKQAKKVWRKVKSWFGW